MIYLLLKGEACMAKETDVILRSVLLHLKTSKTLKQAIIRIEGLCDKDLIAAVEKAVQDEQAEISEHE